MLQFEEVQAFIVHLENLLHLRDQLCEKENTDQEEVDQLRKALQMLEEQHHLLWLHTNNQLSQLRSELDKACSEALTWVAHIALWHQNARSNVTQRCVTFSCPCLHTGKQVEPHCGNCSKEKPPTAKD